MKKIIRIKIFLMFLLMAILLGCTSASPVVKVKVDSYSDVLNLGEKTYYLENLESDNFRLEIANKNFALDIDAVLEKKGYKKVFLKKDANYIIRYNFSSKGPYIEQVVSQVYPRNSLGLSYGFGLGGGSRVGAGVHMNSFIGDPFVVENREYYINNLLIRAADRSGKPAWEVLAVNITQFSDMRRIFPYLLNGASEYFGVNSNNIVTVEVPVEVK